MKDEAASLFDETLAPRRRLQRWAAVAVAALFLLRLGAELLPALRGPELPLLDFWQSLRAVSRASPQVVIVAIDEKSIQRFGPPPWPRSEYVPLIERLSKAGASVIGFDFTFGALEREAANNAQLASAMKQARNVVIGVEFTRLGDPSPPEAPPSQALQASALARFESVAIPPAAGLIAPEPALAEAAAAMGHVATVVAEDGRIRVLPLAVQHGDRAYPSLALQIARIYTKTPLEEIRLAGSDIVMGKWEIPISPSGEVLINWPAAGDKAFAQHSFLDVVRGDVPDEAFRGKAVLVAGTAAGLDDRSFPFAPKAPGVLVHAAFLDNVFRFDFSRAPIWAWLAEWALFLALCAAGVWLLPRLGTPLLLGGVPAFVLLLLAVAGFLFVQRGVWLKVVYPSLALLVPLATLLALRLRASERETRDVTAEKTEQQRLLGLSFQEKGMLDMALATFGKLPLSEDMKLVYVNLGLDFENRGQPEKAELAYKRVFDADPSFHGVDQRLQRLGHARGGPLSATAAPAVTARPVPSPREHLAATVDTITPLEDPSAPVWARDKVGVPTEVAAADAGATIQASPDHDATRIDSDVTAKVAEHPTAHVSGLATANIDAQDTARIADEPTARPRSAGGTGRAAVVPGARFGRYTVETHLGRGGMGDVYLVRDTVIGRKAALKTIRVDDEYDASAAIEMRQRFYREAQTAGKLTHPNIVTIHDVGEEQGTSYIVMEFVEGKALTQLMRKRLSLAQIKHVVCATGSALDYAHQAGVVHRDVKPDNIMVTSAGLVKVMDFGIARIMESELTRTGRVMGTPAYMSPEQFSGEKVDSRSDVFSLGVILYELLTGLRPFGGETASALMFAILKKDPPLPTSVDPNLQPVWDAIVQKALAKEREERYTSARELAEAVRDAAS